MTHRREFYCAIGAASLAVLVSPFQTFAKDESLELTAFDKALDEALSHEQEIKNAAADREREIWESGYYAARPLIGRPVPSSQPISERAKRLIIGFEIINKAHYIPTPIWPGGQSGITIGIGYDVGYARPAWLKDDWSSILSRTQLDLLSRACGVTGSAAKGHLAELQSIVIPFDDANRQFHNPMLKMYVAETINALPNASSLSKDCLGALVSLVYNRGPSFQAKGPRYAQMRAIRVHMVKGEVKLIPAEIRSMKDIWNGKGLDGLIRRRELEAQMFEQGLA